MTPVVRSSIAWRSTSGEASVTAARDNHTQQADHEIALITDDVAEEPAERGHSQRV